MHQSAKTAETVASLKDVFPKELKRVIGKVCLQLLPFRENAHIQTNITIVLDGRDQIFFSLSARADWLCAVLVAAQTDCARC